MPNILLITSEDHSPDIGCYGDKTVPTPHLDALAEQENGNDKAALAAMQAYAHLAAEDERHLPRAKEIIWELQAKTGGETP